MTAVRANRDKPSVGDSSRVNYFLHKNQIRNVYFTSRAYVGSEKYAIKYREGKLGERETLNWMQRDASAPVICDYNKTAFAALLI